MSFFSEEINSHEENLWNERAEKRKLLMTEYMLTEDNIFMDYNFEKKELSEVFSVASCYPMFVQLANEKQVQTLKENLYRIEYEYGISSCEKNSVKGNYQWNYPNGWACLQYIMYKGFSNYREKETASRIAGKYVEMIEKTFRETGNLWEKYNVLEGNINVTSEYEMPPMMGWSAGIYLDALEFLKIHGHLIRIIFK